MLRILLRLGKQDASATLEKQWKSLVGMILLTQI